MAFRVDLKTAENGDVDMATADKSKRHRAVKGRCTRKRADRPTPGISEHRMSHSLLRDRSGADQSVLGLEEHCESRRKIIRDSGGNADPEIDQVARAKFKRYASCDNGLGLHGSPVAYEIIDKWRGSHDVVWRDDADRDDVLRGDDHRPGRHCHDRIEITRGQRKGKVT